MEEKYTAGRVWSWRDTKKEEGERDSVTRLGTGRQGRTKLLEVMKNEECVCVCVL